MKRMSSSRLLCLAFALALLCTEAFVAPSPRTIVVHPVRQQPWEASSSSSPITLQFWGQSDAESFSEKKSQQDVSSEVLPEWVASTQGFLDYWTNGWALSYADLTPETPATPLGRAFLATNAVYLAAGVLLTANGEYFLGFLTDLAAVASFNYHYKQLIPVMEQKDIEEQVRLALLLDYTAAGFSILTAIAYLGMLAFTNNWNQGLQDETLMALQVGGLGVANLALCWRYEKGYTYMVFHSIWHLCSGYAGYLIGMAHLHA